MKPIMKLLSSDCRGSDLDLPNVISSLALAFHLPWGVSSKALAWAEHTVLGRAHKWNQCRLTLGGEGSTLKCIGIVEITFYVLCYRRKHTVSMTKIPNDCNFHYSLRCILFDIGFLIIHIFFP